MDSLAEDLLRELECPCCMEYQVPPILQCKNGHNICNSRKPTLQNCPTCRDYFLNTRCTLMENVSSRITHPCKYRESGCTGQFLVDFKEQHEKECLYSPHKCPYVISDQCRWVGPLLHLKEHVRSRGHDFIDGDPLQSETHFPSKENIITRTCIFLFDELSFFYAKSLGNMVQMMVMFVGFKEEAKSYKYKVTIEKPDDARSMSGCLTCSSYIQFTGKQPTVADDSAIFHSTFYKNMANEESLVPVKIEILNSPPKEQMESNSYSGIQLGGFESSTAQREI